MDLTRAYPRSVHEKMLGIVQLVRTIDKGKAKAYGNPGEYNYDCPMDKALFDFLGMNGDELLQVIKNAKSDADIEAYCKQFVDRKAPDDIERWNREWVTRQIAPDRTDVTSWADLLDLDEKRPVPRRHTVAV